MKIGFSNVYSWSPHLAFGLNRSSGKPALAIVVLAIHRSNNLFLHSDNLFEVKNLV